MESKEFIEKYKNNPVKFAEDFLGLKLYASQKILLEELNKDKNEKIFFIRGLRSYLPVYEDFSNFAINEILDKKDS